MKNLLIALFLVTALGIAGCGKVQVSKTTDVKSVSEKMENVEYNCPGMHCSGCEETIKDEVKKMDGVKEVSADSKTKVVKVTYDASKTNKENISKTINAAGYDTQVSSSENKHQCDEDMMKDKKN
ncbi:MAG: cation transporter [Bacteroidetes bacterium]|nr:cation transporter [Bacteroidota bacterium]